MDRLTQMLLYFIQLIYNMKDLSMSLLQSMEKLKIYGMCSETFNFSAKDANDLVTIFWIAFGIGRLSGIILTPFIQEDVTDRDTPLFACR